MIQSESPPWAPSRDYLKVFAVITAITVFGWYSPLSYHALGYVYLLGVVVLSMKITRWPALSAAVLSGMAWDFFCVPPKLSFYGIHFDEGLLLTTYFAVALIGSQLTALRAAADKAELLAESERMHQTLLDSVSHELMTPMSVFRSALEQLAAADTQRRESLVEELRIALHRLERLVENLLTQNRLESGALGPKLDWCSAQELVVAARRALGPTIGEHPLKICVDADLPLFLADAALMEQSITQLLTNAAVHTPASTEIRIDADVRRQHQKQIVISISDSGPGVPEEIRESIFEKFTRGPDARKGGLGLGLSIVRGFMRAQGGDVTLEPSPVGARFTLALPFTEPDTSPQ